MSDLTIVPEEGLLHIGIECHPSVRVGLANVDENTERFVEMSGYDLRYVVADRETVPSITDEEFDLMLEGLPEGIKFEIITPVDQAGKVVYILLDRGSLPNSQKLITQGRITFGGRLGKSPTYYYRFPENVNSSTLGDFSKLIIINSENSAQVLAPPNYKGKYKTYVIPSGRFIGQYVQYDSNGRIIREA